MRYQPSPSTPAGARQRQRDVEHRLRALEQRGTPQPPSIPDPTPLPFHWPGVLAAHLDIRNGPGEFGADGRIHMIRYRRDDAAGAVTVQWRLGSSIVATHTLPAGQAVHVEHPDVAYAQQAIVATITAAGGGAGLTAFVYHR